MPPAPQAEEEKKKLKARELERARVMNKAISQEQDEKLAAMMAGVKRVHAMIPQSSKLDYVNEPQSMVEAERGQGGGRVSGGILEKKGREILRRSKQTSDRAMKPSIEGRGMVLYK
jgi:transcription factor SPN1